MEEMNYSHVYRSLTRRATMSNMPSKWLVINIISWVGISIFLAVKIYIYLAILGGIGFVISNYFLQKAYLSDPFIFSVYRRYYFHQDFYPARSKFNFKSNQEKW